MATPSRIVITGAGIFGVTAALELRRRGHDITLFDRGPVPHPEAASTDISKVIRMDYGADDFYYDLMEEAFRGWDSWNQRWDRPLYHEDGFLLLTRTEMKPGSFEYESFTRLRARGHEPLRVGGEELKRRFPAWTWEKYPDGYLSKRAGWAESGNVVIKLLRKGVRRGVQVRENARIARFLEEGSRVAGVETACGERVRADVVVACTGPWTPDLLPQLQDRMAIVGQPVLHFRVENPSEFQPPHFPVWGADVSTTGWYGFPALDDGRLKVANHGPGRPMHPDDPRTVPEDTEEKFREFLRGTFPEIARAPLVASRLCLYCDSWDGNFFIDHDPDRPGLVVAAGGSGHGFKFAPVLGAIIADVVERRANPFAARFAWRERGRPAAEAARCVGGAEQGA